MEDTGSVERRSLVLAGAEVPVFAGAPEALRAELWIENSGERREVLRGLQVTIEPPSSGEGASGESRAVGRAVTPLVVYPGEARPVPVTVALLPNTPPGEYEATLRVSGLTRPVLLHVAETVRLEVSPREVVLLNRPGELSTKRVVLHNSGNVPLTIGATGAAALGKERLEQETATDVIEGLVAHPETLPQGIDRLARRNRTALEPAGELQLRNLAGVVTLQPGETHPIDLEFVVPEKLEPAARYLARLPLYNADLTIVIAPALELPPEPDRAG